MPDFADRLTPDRSGDSGDRVARAERTVIEDQGDADEISAELKQCSDPEVEIQGKLRAVAEQVTGAKWKPPISATARQKRPVSSPAFRESLEPRSPSPRNRSKMKSANRSKKRLVNLRTRRERLGPVNLGQEGIRGSAGACRATRRPAGRHRKAMRNWKG